MKKLIVLLIMLFAVSAHADTWCGWSGTEGTDCQDDSRGYVVVPSGIPVGIDEANLNDNHGYYRMVTTPPVLGENQVRDSEVWGFADNEISHTWSVRDMTATELDNRIASPMSVTDYYQWKCLLVTGVITQQQAVDNLPPVMVDAYQARKRLLGD